MQTSLSQSRPCYFVLLSQEVGGKKDRLDFAQFHKLYNLIMFEQNEVSLKWLNIIHICIIYVLLQHPHSHDLLNTDPGWVQKGILCFYFGVSFFFPVQLCQTHWCKRMLVSTLCTLCDRVFAPARHTVTRINQRPQQSCSTTSNDSSSTSKRSHKYSDASITICWTVIVLLAKWRKKHVVYQQKNKEISKCRVSEKSETKRFKV